MSTVWERQVVGDSRAGAVASKAFMATALLHVNKGWIFGPLAWHDKEMGSAVEQLISLPF